MASDAGWDLVVCDEAHKLSATFFGGEVKYTKRYRLGQLLSGLTRHFLLMTATPHNGKEQDFQLFLALLDGDRFEGRFRDGIHAPAAVPARTGLRGGEHQLRAQGPAGQRRGSAARRAAGSDGTRLNGRDTTQSGGPHAAGEGDGSAGSISAPRASLAVRQEAVDGVEVCEVCGMLRLTSFRTGRPSYEPADEVSLDDAVPW